MKFLATKQKVANRGVPPDQFLTELVVWAKDAADEIFSPNKVPVDIFAVIKPQLATQMGTDPSGTTILHWESFQHRKAAMLEAMRVHAGFESSWDWNEGVDTTNRTSVMNETGQETGIFQVSFDSEWIDNGHMKAFAQVHDIDTPEKFIPAMKSNHQLALEYYARLVRVNIRWAGPLVRGEINQWLRRDAMEELQAMIA